MVRFLDDRKILVNNFKGYSKIFMEKLERAFRIDYLTPIPFPYYPSNSLMISSAAKNIGSANPQI